MLSVLTYVMIHNVGNKRLSSYIFLIQGIIQFHAVAFTILLCLQLYLLTSVLTFFNKMTHFFVIVGCNLVFSCFFSV